MWLTLPLSLLQARADETHMRARARRARPGNSRHRPPSPPQHQPSPAASTRAQPWQERAYTQRVAFLSRRVVFFEIKRGLARKVDPPLSARAGTERRKDPLSSPAIRRLTPPPHLSPLTLCGDHLTVKAMVGGKIPFFYSQYSATAKLFITCGLPHLPRLPRLPRPPAGPLAHSQPTQPLTHSALPLPGSFPSRCGRPLILAWAWWRYMILGVFVLLYNKVGLV